MARAQARPEPEPRGPWVVGLAGIGYRNGGARDLAGRVELDLAVGRRLRVRIGADGWLGTGDCVTAGREPSAPCPSPSGSSLGGRLAVVLGGSGVAPYLMSGVGAAMADGARFLTDIGFGLDGGGSRRTGVRVEASYRRLYGLDRPDRLSLAAGLRVAIGRGVPGKLVAASRSP